VRIVRELSDLLEYRQIVKIENLKTIKTSSFLKVGLLILLNLLPLILWLTSYLFGYMVFQLSLTCLCFAAVLALLELYFFQKQLSATKLSALSALEDELTSKGNRRAFESDLDKLLGQTKRRSSSFVLIYLDLDNLKPLNDIFGHATGDKALIALTDSLSRSIRAGDSIYRLGGDEFAVLLPDCLENGASMMLERARDQLSENQIPYPLGVSAGLAEYPRDAETSGALCLLADSRLYKDKKGRKVRKPRPEKPRQMVLAI